LRYPDAWQLAGAEDDASRRHARQGTSRLLKFVFASY
jgi:hypothetical protein